MTVLKWLISAVFGAWGVFGICHAQVDRVEDLVFPPLPELSIPRPERVVLENGMVVLMMEDHELPLVDVTIYIRTGSRYEPPEKIGLATLTGSVMRSGGTRSMSGDALDDYLEGKAAVIETAIDVTAGTASMNCLKADFPDVLRIFSDLLRYPAFDERKLAIAKSQAIAAIARQNDNPDDILSREFRKLVYGPDSPYARTPTYATINNISRADLVKWHRTYFHPDRMILGLTGDFDPAEALALIQQVFGDWPAGPPSHDLDVPYRTQASPAIFYAEKNDMTQAKIAMGHLGVTRRHPDYYALVIVNEILSGSFGSRLFSNIRSKQGLAYDVSGGVGFGWDYPGLAMLSMSTKVQTTAKGIEALRAEARRLVAEPPTAEEVKKAKASVLNSFVFSVDSPAKILAKFLIYEYYDYPSDWLQRFRPGIEGVTVAQVRQAAQKHLRPHDFVTLVVGPEEGVAPALARYPQVHKLDITVPPPPADMLKALRSF
ncbi:MAG: insulinase family protein [Nitrospirae bacterium]|nr:MAG: insulinase family protein [Nitrospirota bacterium]